MDTEEGFWDTLIILIMMGVEYLFGVYLQCTFRKTRLLTAGGTSLEAMQRYAPICRRTTPVKFKWEPWNASAESGRHRLRMNRDNQSIKFVMRLSKLVSCG